MGETSVSGNLDNVVPSQSHTYRTIAIIASKGSIDSLQNLIVAKSTFPIFVVDGTSALLNLEASQVDGVDICLLVSELTLKDMRVNDLIKEATTMCIGLPWMIFSRSFQTHIDRSKINMKSAEGKTGKIKMKSEKGKMAKGGVLLLHTNRSLSKQLADVTDSFHVVNCRNETDVNKTLMNGKHIILAIANSKLLNEGVLRQLQTKSIPLVVTYDDVGKIDITWILRSYALLAISEPIASAHAWFLRPLVESLANP